MSDRAISDRAMSDRAISDRAMIVSRTIDDRLAALLRGEAAAIVDLPAEALVERVMFHGIAGLLAGHLAGWPDPIAAPLRDQARAQAMWEMRHRVVLGTLLADFAAAGVAVRVLKGTALAYDLYARPADRARGDTDLLVAPDTLVRARAVLEEAGYVPFYDDPVEPGAARMQEPWRLDHPDGTTHEIDLHWQVLNRRILAGCLPVAAAFESGQPLPALCPMAQAMARHLTLIHACAHRAAHLTSPYFVGGAGYYGGDRLIWLWDIALLAQALDDAGWEAFASHAARVGLGPVCAQALAEAQTRLVLSVPEGMMARLGDPAAAGPAAAYLQSGNIADRARRDLKAVKGLGARLRFVRYRLFPPAPFMRANYPENPRAPLVWLYLRRLARFAGALRGTPAGRGRS